MKNKIKNMSLLLWVVIAEKESLEAGITTGWQKFTGIDGLNIGINEFGASAPGKDVAKHLGFVKEKITSLIEDYLNE